MAETGADFNIDVDIDEGGLAVIGRMARARVPAMSLVTDQSVGKDAEKTAQRKLAFPYRTPRREQSHQGRYPDAIGSLAHGSPCSGSRSRCRLQGGCSTGTLRYCRYRGGSGCGNHRSRWVRRLGLQSGFGRTVDGHNQGCCSPGDQRRDTPHCEGGFEQPAGNAMKRSPPGQ